MPPACGFLLGAASLLMNAYPSVPGSRPVASPPFKMSGSIEIFLFEIFLRLKEAVISGIDMTTFPPGHSILAFLAYAERVSKVTDQTSDLSWQGVEAVTSSLRELKRIFSAYLFAP